MNELQFLKFQISTIFDFGAPFSCERFRELFKYLKILKRSYFANNLWTESIHKKVRTRLALSKSGVHVRNQTFKKKNSGRPLEATFQADEAGGT